MTAIHCSQNSQQLCEHQEDDGGQVLSSRAAHKSRRRVLENHSFSARIPQVIKKLIVTSESH